LTCGGDQLEAAFNDAMDLLGIELLAARREVRDIPEPELMPMFGGQVFGRNPPLNLLAVAYAILLRHCHH
jgi:hypothetical protein